MTRQFAEEIRREHVEATEFRVETFLVVARCRVDQNDLVAAAHKPGMNAGKRAAGFGIDPVDIAQFRKGVENRGIEIGELLRRVKARRGKFLDPLNGDVSDLPCRHEPIPPCPRSQLISVSKSCQQTKYISYGETILTNCLPWQWIVSANKCPDRCRRGRLGRTLGEAWSSRKDNRETCVPSPAPPTSCGRSETSRNNRLRRFLRLPAWTRERPAGCF